MKKFDNLGNEYKNHKIFQQLSEIESFYDFISFSTMGIVNLGTSGILNLDTYVFSSIKGTINSISQILINGRINDSYALLRKYYDSTIINIYTNLYLEDHFSIENFVVEHIENWKKGTDTIPDYRIISQYIQNSAKLKPISDLIVKDNLYKNIRNRCNDHTHYNYYHNILLNDNQISLEYRNKALDVFSKDLTAVFIQHFAYLFYLKDHYMMSSDYIDALDLGITPEEGSQYWVSPKIQDIFTNWIKTNRNDIAEIIKAKTAMNLE